MSLVERSSTRPAGASEGVFRPDHALVNQPHPTLHGSHRRQFDRAPACVALGALPTKAGFVGDRQRGDSALCEADAEMQSQAGIAVSERALLLEELPNLEDCAAPRNRSGQIGTRWLIGAPRMSKEPERTRTRGGIQGRIYANETAERGAKAHVPSSMRGFEQRS